MSSVFLQRLLTRLLKNLLHRIICVTQLPVILILYIYKDDDDNEKGVYKPWDIICYVLCPKCFMPFFHFTTKVMSSLCPHYVLVGGIL